MSNLGETLKERRRHLGISIAQAEEATKIRGRILEALEEGDQSNLPDAGYVRGFISSYARFLELDPAPLLQMYRAETGHKRHLDLDLPQINEAVKPTGQQHAVPVRGAIMVVVAIAVLSAAIWVIVSSNRGTKDELPPVPVVPQGSTATAPPSQDDTPVQQPKQQTQEVLPFTLVVAVDGDTSWLRITIDDKKAYEGVLADGQSKRYEVVSSAEVRIGNPSVVSVMKNGTKITIPNGDTPTVSVRATPSD